MRQSNDCEPSGISSLSASLLESTLLTARDSQRGS